MSQIQKRMSATRFSPNRLEALTDGVFAIVMTLLVLELSIPEIAHSSVQAELPQRLLELGPKLISYAVSFIILGMFWYLHHHTFHLGELIFYRQIGVNLVSQFGGGTAGCLGKVLFSRGVYNLP